MIFSIEHKNLSCLGRQKRFLCWWRLRDSMCILIPGEGDQNSSSHQCLHWWQEVSTGHFHREWFESFAHQTKKPTPSGGLFVWWRLRDSNLWPHACEACALTSWAKPPWNRIDYSTFHSIVKPFSAISGDNFWIWYTRIMVWVHLDLQCIPLYRQRCISESDRKLRWCECLHFRFFLAWWFVLG